MLRAGTDKGLYVIRRVGGLEVRQAALFTSGHVIRRVGGLEDQGEKYDASESVIRRVGGLEV